jgi:hypothetical protein
MRTRAFRRHQSERHMSRRLKEDRNQHYRNLDCPCWQDPREMGRFKEQPKTCNRSCCVNPRRNPLWKGEDRLTIQERRYALPLARDEISSLDTTDG